MLRKFLRQISIFLSFTSNRKNKINIYKHNKVEKLLNKNLPNFILKNPRLSTHTNLSNEILKIITNKKLKNFLRNSFIQNIFFIHNRLFIYSELKELKKDKKWKLWKKLISDNGTEFLVNLPKTKSLKENQAFKRFIYESGSDITGMFR